MFIWTALLLGLGGSLHCVGMCGPIAMALPLTARERKQVVFQSLLYHFGRITTYGLLGLMMGLLGWGIALTGYQKIFSIGLGVVLLVTAVFSISIENEILSSPFFISKINWVKHKLGQLLSIKGKSSAFKIGMLNGILPCGLVYIALAGAVASGSYLNGALYMIAFGFGTLPLLLTVMVIGKLNPIFFTKFRKLIPLGLVFFALLLIYRGLMLDIPANLAFWEANNFPVLCH